MVENAKCCVLQWTDHPKYITEKFSGLLARQALVDVTLVCEDQKLRVHKLILASNSIYFEEILQQDLGQEPVIFLKDLNFEILKAMVEFMYCGETRISYQLLSPLLTATKKFKVKELTTVVDAMMSSNVGSFEINDVDKEVTETKIISNTCNNTDYIHVKCNELVKNECFVLCNKSNSDVNTSENQSSEGNTISDSPEQELEHILYEESQDFETNPEQTNTLFSVGNSTKLMGNENLILLTNDKMKEISNEEIEYPGNRIINSDTLCTNNELKPILYEQCCDLSDIDECEESSMSLSQSCLQQIEKDFAQYKFEGANVPNKVGKCIKVYTHKRRKSIDEIKNKLTDMNNIIQNPPSTDCIDLLDEPSTTDIPVTLLTSLDMESAEYIISLNTKNIQSIVGATLTEQHTLNKCKDLEEIIECNAQQDSINKTELNTQDTEISNCSKPILRRSLRLNQQEIEETINNNETIKTSTEKKEHFKKSNFSNKTELCIKRKRKIKDVDRKVPEQIINNVIQPIKKTFNNSRRNTKLIVKKNKCIISNKEKDEQTVKITNKLKCGISEATNIDSIFTLPKLNTIEHINRALWGDMTDFAEDYKNRINLLENSSNTEIPFAVGLLPLRTALEKMQATPDYQPRKTRSSVAPIRQEINNLKRKNCTHLVKVTDSKKQNMCINDPKENAKAVCHIQIRTAPSQYVRTRKKYLSTDINSLESPIIINKN
ncbi:MATH and LRR domain-containing protein PFE0570w isoform X1 [Apis mellifera]|uniref:MATH and LRR domain-containing protein PFE0570w isoform X1 n=2 Tax=Apis mellifera TaxID=7460 RepID=A0A7M7MKV2_APIME|nr:MATH and LRR domain-containing protein PFE0570w isoform X1 [Apis mellifera]|eukprot:XP_026297494.1 MATH and LRR domain-containing protein PFE0570w isoform X1 [Apis mellifera]